MALFLKSVLKIKTGVYNIQYTVYYVWLADPPKERRGKVKIRELKIFFSIFSHPCPWRKKTKKNV